MSLGRGRSKWKQRKVSILRVEREIEREIEIEMKGKEKIIENEKENVIMNDKQNKDENDYGNVKCVGNIPRRVWSAPRGKPTKTRSMVSPAREPTNRRRYGQPREGADQ